MSLVIGHWLIGSWFVVRSLGFGLVLRTLHFALRTPHLASRASRQMLTNDDLYPKLIAQNFQRSSSTVVALTTSWVALVRKSISIVSRVSLGW